MKNDKTKILLFITKAEIGGAQNHIDYLIRSLSQNYHFVLCSGSEGVLSENAKQLGVDVHIIPQLTNKLFFPALIAVYRLIKTEQPDLVHTHSAIASFVGRIAGRWAGVKTLYTVHGWHFVPNSVWKRRWFGWVLELMARPFTSAWITVSQYDLKLGLVRGVINSQRAWVVSNGVEDIKVALNNKKYNSLGLDLVFVGRASFQKNCIEAIEVLELCDETVSLTMFVTSGDHLPALKKRIRGSVAIDRLTLITDDSEASGALSQFDAMLMTSRYEGMPLCALEAMRTGLPIVTTNVCGLCEIVDHAETGFLYELGDIDAAAQHINALRNKYTWEKLSIAARKRFEREFDAHIMATHTAEIYQKLLTEQ